MNLKEAQALSKCHRPGADADAPQVQKAVRAIAADPAMKAAFDAQVEFDAAQARLLDSIKPGEDLLNRIDETLEKLQQKSFQWSLMRHPAFLAGAVAVVVVIGVLIWALQDMKENFPGRDSVEKMVDTASQLNSKTLEPKTAQAGELGDWFFSKGYEDFRILPQFAAQNAAGARIFKFKQDDRAVDHAVAQITFADHNAVLNIFHLGDFDIQLDPPERWRVFEQNDYAVAIRADTGTGFMVMFKGRKSDMEDYLNALPK
ncbi:MAG TPA: hypothetical protein VG733_13055 [Chthoniobacteraceae bacterium]|nr:hypothetical protein [Chthoniobacteraceae bacterium]